MIMWADVCVVLALAVTKQMQIKAIRNALGLGIIDKDVCGGASILTKCTNV